MYKRQPLGPVWRPGTTVKCVSFLPGDRFLASGTDLHSGTVLLIDKPEAVSQKSRDVIRWVEVCTGISSQLAVLAPERWEDKRGLLTDEPKVELAIWEQQRRPPLEWNSRYAPVVVKPPEPPKPDPVPVPMPVVIGDVKKLLGKWEGDVGLPVVVEFAAGLFY